MRGGMLVLVFENSEVGDAFNDRTEAEYVALADSVNEAMFIRCVCGASFFLVVGRGVSGISRTTRGRYS